jgi:mannose-1-phosphate guanylyltransferase
MIRAIILAGGEGTRFWPLSRAHKPKQLLKLFSDKTLLEETVARVESIVDSVAISTGKNLEEPIRGIFPEVKMIVEPARRDTAAAIGLCASQFDDDDILVFLPSDSYIDDVEKFQEAISIAIERATDGVVVVGIKPTYAATGYGYIEPGDDWKVNSFKEKPDKNTAEMYLREGYCWNAGIFVCKVSIMMELFSTYAPEIYEKLIEIRKTGDIDGIYPTIEKTSFDYAVMEKAEKVYYVPAEFKWNDVGSFDALSEIIDDKNVVLEGNVIEIDSKNNVVHAGKTVALIDCENLVVIDTKDALLVCPKSSVQKVKHLVEKDVDEKLR